MADLAQAAFSNTAYSDMARKMMQLAGQGQKKAGGPLGGLDPGQPPYAGLNRSFGQAGVLQRGPGPYMPGIMRKAPLQGVGGEAQPFAPREAMPRV